MTQPLTLHSWPKAILHVDADAFFVSVEQTLHPELKGKPVITGAERGIVAAASYEAKAFGVKRGVSLTEAAHLCPGLIMLPSDYETYSLFSKRMFNIVRRFTPEIEEYSIDEAFADLTGLRRVHHAAYQDIAKEIQQTIIRELDVGVSVGVSLSKSLAKLCSKFRKPRGFAAVPGHTIHLLLERTPLLNVWGFGPNTTALLAKHGCRTALDFVRKPRYFAEEVLGKVGVEIWSELRGEYVYRINTAPKTDYASISKSKTFAPPSSNQRYVFAQALRNLESAFIKARRYALAANRLVVYLREQNFASHGCEATLNRPTNSPLDCTNVLRGLFEQCFHPDRTYRATGIVLADLQPALPAQCDLFEDPLRAIKTATVAKAIDEVNAQFGKHTVFLGEGLHLGRTSEDRLIGGRRGTPTVRRAHPLPGETARQHLALPLHTPKMVH
ncbi:MAG: DNA polymerase IV [Deltaproteobacteria bacterium]|nr:DNA polymerase IV [Deltaproteobacteria bacterium]